jgi:hypothetical protein
MHQTEDDLPLNRSPHESPSPPADERRPFLLWMAGLVALIVIAGAGIVLWRLWVKPVPPSSATTGRAALPAAKVAGAPAPAAVAVDLPPLDLSDGLVRNLLGQLSSRAEVTRWLATDGLIRNFVVALENVSEGKSPTRHLHVLAPASAFRVASRPGGATIDARSYDRYNALADAVDSFDAAGLARLYVTLKPRLVEAYRDLGHPDGDIDAAVERAIVHLLRAPTIPADPRLTAASVSYRFADEDIESLSAAQKQLLRMGPRNGRLVQAKLRQVAAALGIPDARLPKPGAE